MNGNYSFLRKASSVLCTWVSSTWLDITSIKSESPSGWVICVCGLFQPTRMMNQIDEHIFGFQPAKKDVARRNKLEFDQESCFFHFWTGRTWKWITETWDWPDLNLVVGQLSVVIPCKVFPCTDDIEMCFSIFIQFLQSYIKAFDFVGICSRIWNRPCGQRTIQNMDNEPFQLGVYSLWTAIQSTCFLYIYLYI